MRKITLIVSHRWVTVAQPLLAVRSVSLTSALSAEARAPALRNIAATQDGNGFAALKPTAIGRDIEEAIAFSNGGEVA